MRYSQKTKNEIERETGWTFYKNEIKYECNNVDLNDPKIIIHDTCRIFRNRKGFYVPNLEFQQLDNQRYKKINNVCLNFMKENENQLCVINFSENRIEDIMNGDYELSDLGKKINDPQIPILIAQNLGYEGVPKKYQYINKSELHNIKKK